MGDRISLLEAYQEARRHGLTEREFREALVDYMRNPSEGLAWYCTTSWIGTYRFHVDVWLSARPPSDATKATNEET